MTERSVAMTADELHAKYQHHPERLGAPGCMCDIEADRLSARDRHESGQPHEYRIECVVCGQRGVIRLAVEPQTFEPDPWDSPEGKKMIAESEAYADAMLGDAP